MPRRLRIEYPGAMDHVMSRANGTGNIFESDVDRQDFVKTLAETCGKAGVEVHGYLEEPQRQTTSVAESERNTLTDRPRLWFDPYTVS